MNMIFMLGRFAVWRSNFATFQEYDAFGTYRAFSVKERFIVPVSFKRFLNQISRPNGVVYKTK